MSHNQHPHTFRPPYPDDSNPPHMGAQEPYPPSLSAVRHHGEAQSAKMARGPSAESNTTAKADLPDSLKVGSPVGNQVSHASETENSAETGGVMLPDSLRVGAGGDGGSRRGGGTPGENFGGADMPEALRPGGGNMGISAEHAQVHTHSVPADKKQQSEMHGALEKDAEPTMHGVLVTGNEDSEDIWGTEKTPVDRRESEDVASPMAANFNAYDRPFNEYSPFYNPTNNFSTSSSKIPSHANQTEGYASSGPQRSPPVAPVQPDQDRDRQFSVASTASSIFDPGMDLSCFDASTTRALPGRRGYPSIGMEGWKEDEEEDNVAKTWEEELDRRARVGAELQRRNEEAQEREREERLQAEFWEEERRLAEVAEAPHKPPKAPSSTDGENSVGVDPQTPLPDQSRPVPPIPVDAMANLNIRPPPPPPPSANTTTEIYQIKHIGWTDPSVPKAPLRRSPILLQNANGPCPLLALVNALILSTPVGSKTALWETLELREQVSLELLLDAVFQELMDRGTGSTEIPDVSDLFAFLLTLHTGMNVNPRFYSEDNPSNTQTMHFENTREMELYGAFRVPLVHGWLPSPSDPVLKAMKRRSVCNYEEAQTLLFHEGEIISRVTSENGSLEDGEEQIIEDAGIIRDWMDRSKTQLTAHGLDVVKTGLKTGDVAILFRNDHFMTVIGGRDAGALMGLVTDMGFAGHEEVVWERMVDVQGRNNEFLSGDFRPVGAGDRPPPPPARQEVRSLLDPDEAWETIPGVTDTHIPATGDINIVDHDADLAYALQLQEEEEERYRNQQDAEQQRQRRHGPSQSMGGQPRNMPPPPPPRHPGNIAQFTHRPADGTDAIPPPPYERHPNQPQQPQQSQPDLTAYQQQQQIQQQQVWAAGRGRRASFGATPAIIGIQASGGMSPAQRRAEAARNLMSEFANNAGTPSSSAQHQQYPGRRSSLSEAEQKEKCVIC